MRRQGRGSRKYQSATGEMKMNLKIERQEKLIDGKLDVSWAVYDTHYFQDNPEIDCDPPHIRYLITGLETELDARWFAEAYERGDTRAIYSFFKGCAALTWETKDETTYVSSCGGLSHHVC
jgi:hypothetical protein